MLYLVRKVCAVDGNENCHIIYIIRTSSVVYSYCLFSEIMYVLFLDFYLKNVFLEYICNTPILSNSEPIEKQFSMVGIILTKKKGLVCLMEILKR